MGLDPSENLMAEKDYLILPQHILRYVTLYNI